MCATAIFLVHPLLRKNKSGCPSRCYSFSYSDTIKYSFMENLFIPAGHLASGWSPSEHVIQTGALAGFSSSRLNSYFSLNKLTDQPVPSRPFLEKKKEKDVCSLSYRWVHNNTFSSVFLKLKFITLQMWHLAATWLTSVWKKLLFIDLKWPA